MVYKRVLKLLIIVGVMLICIVLPALAAEEVLAEQSAVGNHYETPLVLNLAAGQVININAYCTDASGTGIVYVHYVEVGAVPTVQHPEYNDSIYYQRWDCVPGVGASYTAPVAAQYRFIFHVHTNEYGCGAAESCSTLTGISHFNYYLKVTTDTANGTPPPATEEPTIEPTSDPTAEVTPDPTNPEVTPEPTDPVVTAEPTVEPTSDPTAEVTPDPTTPEVTPEPTDPVVTAEPTGEATTEPTPEDGETTPTTPPPANTRRPVVVPSEPNRDARLNWGNGDLTAVIYRNRDHQGAAVLVIYGVGNSGGYFLCSITRDDLGVFASQAPLQNALVKTCSDSVRVYVLVSGEIQVNIQEGDKLFVTIVDSLAANTVKLVPSA